MALSLNLVGLDVLSRVAAVMLVAVVAPFAVALVMLWPRVVDGSENIVALPPGGLAGVVWSLWLPATLWSFTGWDALGAVAGSVERPGRTYCFGSLLAVVMVATVYALPLITGAALHPDLSTWTDGCLVRFARDAATWVGDWVAGAAVLANFGLLCATLAATSRALWAMAAGDEGGGGAAATAEEEGLAAASPRTPTGVLNLADYGSAAGSIGGLVLERSGQSVGGPAAVRVEMSGALLDEEAGAEGAVPTPPESPDLLGTTGFGPRATEGALAMSEGSAGEAEEERRQAAMETQSLPALDEAEDGGEGATEEEDEAMETQSLPRPDEVDELKEEMAALPGIAGAAAPFVWSDTERLMGPKSVARSAAAWARPTWHKAGPQSIARTAVTAVPSAAPLLAPSDTRSGSAAGPAGGGAPAPDAPKAVVHAVSPQLLPEWVGWKWRRFGTPASALVLQSLSALGLALFLDFDLLLQITGLMACIRLLFEFTAFVQLRRMGPPPAQPDGSPPRFVIPGGWWGVLAVSLPKLGVVLTVLILSSATAWFAALGVNAVLVVVVLARLGFGRVCALVRRCRPRNT